jgi:ABC-type uncharacterized transport system involved in gliding motility auxiliary subunit
VTEEDVTNALTKIIKGETKTIYFTEGHGEKPIDGGEMGDYQLAAKDLEKAGYAVKKLNLAREGKVPEDAAAVVVAGPQNEPFAPELDMLDAYLRAGGSLLLLLDPPPAASLKELTKKWSIEVADNRVIDVSGYGKLFGTGPAIPLVADYKPHTITSKFQGTFSFFPVTRSVSPATSPAEGVTVESLLETSEASWGESDLTSDKVGFDEKADVKGPVPIASVATKDAGEDKKSRLIVYGDSDFAVNRYFHEQANGDLFTNTVRWLVQDESFIAIAVKNPEDRPITMTESQGRIVGLTAMFFFPGAIIAAGIFMWAKRRR